MSEPEIGTGKTVFVIAVVLGCFAVLYPKIFYHMMFEEKKDKPDHMRPGPHEFGRPPMHHGHPALHMRNEQGKLFYGEEGHQVRRTIDKELKPGPVPGMRPTMGGPGLPQIPRGNQGGGGTMSILMPLYTTGIVIFFVYTVMKIMFKKNDENSEAVDDRSSRRLHQQLRNKAITPEFMQHQQRVSAANYEQSLTTAASIPKEAPATASNVPQIKETVPKKEEKVVEVAEKKEEPDIKKSETNEDPRDEQIRILKERLEETEKAMQLIISNMAVMTSQLPKVDAEKEDATSKSSGTTQIEKSDTLSSAPSRDSKAIEAETKDSEEEEEDSDDEDDEDSDDEEDSNNIENLNSKIPLAQES